MNVLRPMRLNMLVDDRPEVFYWCKSWQVSRPIENLDARVSFLVSLAAEFS